MNRLQYRKLVAKFVHKMIAEDYKTANNTLDVLVESIIKARIRQAILLDEKRCAMEAKKGLKPKKVARRVNKSKKKNG